MTDGLASIITDLELRKTAIDRALIALREVGDSVPDWVTGSTAPERKGKKLSAASRKKMADGQRRRWRKARGE